MRRARLHQHAEGAVKARELEHPQALAERGVNITGIVGVAEDTDGALMLTTSDPAASREAFAGLGLAFEEHDPAGGLEPDSMSVSDLRPGAAGRGTLG